jgi:aminopeptidase-like protein
MSKRNLRPTLSIKNKYTLSPFSFSRSLTNFLQYADGKNDLKSIAKILNISSHETKKIYKILKKNNLIID